MFKNLKRNRIGLYEKALPNGLSWEEKIVKATAGIRLSGDLGG
jgi:L-ribulose-5-phosphate 3-epimerase UlaE